jgi:alpha-methylacyl-CoA racemase
MAVGAIEEKFYGELLARLGLDSDRELSECQMQPSCWPRLRSKLAAAFRTKSREEWSAIFDGSDACVAPILRMSEAEAHPHLRARGTLLELDGLLQPAPAPRFDRTPSVPATTRATVGAQSSEILASLGYSSAEAASLKERGAVH